MNDELAAEEEFSRRARQDEFIPNPLESLGRDEEFSLHLRARRLQRGLMVGALLALSYVAYAFWPSSVTHLLALNPELRADDPRQFLQHRPSAAEQQAYQSVEPVFAVTLPAWLEEVRSFHSSTGPRDPRAFPSLSQARERLEASVQPRQPGDEALAAIVGTLIQLGERAQAQDIQPIAETLDNLNLLARSRQWPFEVQGGLEQDEKGLSLNIRIYEQVGEQPFTLDGQSVVVQILDRLNLQRYFRSPDPVLQADRKAVLYARTVMQEANRQLLASLPPGGRWLLEPRTPSEETAKALELSLGERVRSEWNTFLDAHLTEAERQELPALTRQIEQRNRLYRDINDRDPRRLSITDPTSIAGSEGSMRLSYLEPYAARGKVRITVEDLVALKKLDQALDERLQAASAGIQQLYRERMQQAAARELRFEQLMGQPQKPVPAFVKLEAGADALSTSAFVGSALASVVDGGAMCSTSLAVQVGAALDSDHPEKSSARWVLQLLSESKAAAKTRAEVLTQAQALMPVSCESLGIKAKAAYVQHFGALAELTPTSGSLASSHTLVP